MITTNIIFVYYLSKAENKLMMFPSNAYLQKKKKKKKKEKYRTLEPEHDKTNKMIYSASKDSDKPGHPHVW